MNLKELMKYFEERGLKGLMSMNNNNNSTIFQFIWFKHKDVDENHIILGSSICPTNEKIDVEEIVRSGVEEKLSINEITLNGEKVDDETFLITFVKTKMGNQNIKSVIFTNKEFKVVKDSLNVTLND